MSKGQFSLIDILVHSLRTTVPANVVMSTWAAAGADLDVALELLRGGWVCGVIVDFSFPARQPEYCAAMRERFGDGATRVTKSHCKFVVVTNEPWSVVIRSSMNLNENRRLESFEISDDRGMADYLLELVEGLFADHEPGAQFAEGPYENTVDFERLGESVSDAEAAGRAKELDRGKYFRDGVFDTDLRRSGWTSATTGKPVG